MGQKYASVDLAIDVPPDHLMRTQGALSIEERIALARHEGLCPPSTAEDDFLKRRHILHLIALDAEVRVRMALADSLAENLDAPHDLVLMLAQDVDLVASPLLRQSEVLTDEDLMAIIECQTSATKMADTAVRDTIGPVVCMVLIEKGDATVAELLLRNEGADIPEPGFLGIADRHGRLPGIQSGLVERSSLPPTVIEKVVALVSAELLNRLVERHDLPLAVASKLASTTRDRATLGLATGLSSDAMSKLVDQLSSERRLTHSLLLRSMCLGNFDLLIHAIAVRCALGVGYVRERLVNGPASKIDELWSRAALPPTLLPLAKSSVQILLETNSDGAKWDVDHYRGRVAERMLSQFADYPEFSEIDLSYIMAAAGSHAGHPDDFAPSQRLHS